MRDNLYFAECPRFGIIKVGVSVDPISRKRRFPHMLRHHGLPEMQLEYLGWLVGVSYPEEAAFRERFRAHKFDRGNDFFRDVPQIREYIATLTLERHRGSWYNAGCGCSICAVKMLCECGRCSVCYHKRKA